jgi:hypothetical protein
MEGMMNIASARSRLAAGLFCMLVLPLVGCGGSDVPPDDAGAGTVVPASISLTVSAASVAPGQTVTVSATVKDSQGNVLAGQSPTWQSSNAAVATISGGVVTAVAQGSVNISASIGALTSNLIALSVVAVAPPGTTSSSSELIDAALAAGEIDAETALTYKVFAVYLDPRLPAKYAGDDSGSFEAQAVEDFRVGFDTLSPATQAMLAPYLLRPADVGSWRDPGVRAAMGAPRERALALREQPLARPTCQGALSGWAVVDTTNGKARVWYYTDYVADGIAAHKVAGYIDANVWPVLINTLGYKEPLDDKRLVGCDGGDGRLDIYMVVIADRGQTWASNSANALGSNFQDAAYILINPQLPDEELKLTTAHEVMHAIHWAYVSHAPGLANGWFRDGLANWGADQVFNGNVPLNTLASCHFNSAELSLTDNAAGYCNGLPRVSRNYGAHLPLQFLAKTRGVNVVKDILVATGGSAGSAVEALNNVVPFKSWWPEYARKLWNRDTVTARDAPATFDDWDTLTNVPRHTPMLATDGRNNTDARLNGSLEESTPIATDVANLSVRYYRYTFGGEVNTRSVMFHNTFYDNWKNGQAVSVRAFFKAEGQAWDEEDWTDVEWIGFCRDWKLQRLDELVVVVASAEWTGANPKVIAAQAPELMRNVVGCWEFKGEAKRTDTFASSGKSGSVVATYQAKFDGHPGNVPLQYTDRSAGRLRVPIAAPLFSGGDWTLLESYSQSGCSYSLNSGGSSGSVTSGGSSSGLMIFNNFNQALPAGLRPAEVTGAPSRAYFGEGQTINEVSGTVSGTDCGSTYKSAVGVWWVTRTGITNTKVVDEADGRLKGSYVVPGRPAGDSTVFTWDLVPMRE